MGGGALVGATALWLGILTSISPCPLATNLAAISYLVKALAEPWRVLASGALYTFGLGATVSRGPARILWCRDRLAGIDVRRADRMRGAIGGAPVQPTGAGGKNGRGWLPALCSSE